jgi:hypothetical protein
MDAVPGVWALEYSRQGDPNHGMFAESIRSILDGLQERIGWFFGRRGIAHMGKIYTFTAVRGFISRSGIKQELYFIVKAKF